MKWYRKLSLVIIGALALLMAQFTASPAEAVISGPPSPSLSGIRPQGTSYHGFTIIGQSNVTGIQAMISTGSEVVLNRGTPVRNVTVHVAAMHPPTDSCLEIASTVYTLSNGVPHHTLGVWDSCSVPNGWYYLQEWNATLKAKYEYTLTFPSPYNYVSLSNKLVTVQIVRANTSTNCWQAQAFNNQTAAWDTLYSVCNSHIPAQTTGWFFNETYGWETASSSNMCVGLGTGDALVARGLKVRYSTLPAPSWAPVDTSMHGTEYTDADNCFPGPEWIYRLGAANVYGDSWIICGPTSIACDN